MYIFATYLAHSLFFVWTDCAISSAPFGLLFSPVVGSQELTWNFVNNYAFGKFCYVFQSKTQDTLTFQEQFSVSFRSFESRKQNPKKKTKYIFGKLPQLSSEMNNQLSNHNTTYYYLFFWHNYCVLIMSNCFDTKKDTLKK